MPVRNATELVSFGADAVVDRLADDGGVRAVVEYRGERYRTLYVTDATVERYGSVAAVDDVAARVHRSIYLDLREEELYDDLFVDVGDLRAFVLRFEEMTVVRYTDGDEGLYVGLDTDAPVRPVLDAIEAILRSTEN